MMAACTAPCLEIRVIGNEWIRPLMAFTMICLYIKRNNSIIAIHHEDKRISNPNMIICDKSILLFQSKYLENVIIYMFFFIQTVFFSITEKYYTFIV